MVLGCCSAGLGNHCSITFCARGGGKNGGLIKFSCTLGGGGIGGNAEQLLHEGSGCEEIEEVSFSACGFATLQVWRCRFKVPCCVNAFLQCMHLYGFSPEEMSIRFSVSINMNT